MSENPTGLKGRARVYRWTLSARKVQEREREIMKGINNLKKTRLKREMSQIQEASHSQLFRKGSEKGP